MKMPLCHASKDHLSRQLGSQGLHGAVLKKGKVDHTGNDTTSHFPKVSQQDLHLGYNFARAVSGYPGHS
jgi:hypothetical protein